MLTDIVGEIRISVKSAPVQRYAAMPTTQNIIRGLGPVLRNVIFFNVHTVINMFRIVDLTGYALASLASAPAACYLHSCEVVLSFRHAANGWQATVGQIRSSNLLFICKYLQLLMKLIIQF